MLPTGQERKSMGRVACLCSTDSLGIQLTNVLCLPRKHSSF